jgi:hypothetical protein
MRSLSASNGSWPGEEEALKANISERTEERREAREEDSWSEV